MYTGMTAKEIIIRFFHVLSLKFKYPHKIKMYFFDNCVNLGFLTIIIDFIYFSFFAFVWIICIMGAIDIICVIYKYGCF